MPLHPGPPRPQQHLALFLFPIKGAPMKAYYFYLFLGFLVLAIIFGFVGTTPLYVVFVLAAIGSIIIASKQTPNHPVSPAPLLEPIPPPQPSEIVSPIVKRKEEFLKRKEESLQRKEQRIQKDFDLRIQAIKDGILQAEANGEEYCHFYAVGEFKIETSHLLELMKQLGHRAYFERRPHYPNFIDSGHLVIAFFDFSLPPSGYDYAPITKDFPSILFLTQRD